MSDSTLADGIQTDTASGSSPCSGARGAAHPFRRFDGMVWIDPNKISDLQWRLLFAPESVTREDQLALSSLIMDYRELVKLPRAKREQICAQLRKTE
jgi:hypothetical protein